MPSLLSVPYSPSFPVPFPLTTPESSLLITENLPIRHSPFRLIMAALCNRGAIIFLLCSFYLSFFPRQISAAADWMSTILFYTWRGPNANL